MKLAKIFYSFAVFMLSSACLVSLDVSFDSNAAEKKSRKEHSNFQNIYVDTNSITHYLDHYLFEENIKDPFRILRSWRLIDKKPEKVADAFLEIISSMTDDEKKRIVEEYSGQLSLLLDRLDSKSSVKFQSVLEEVVKTGLAVNPEIFENFKPIAENVIKRYVEEYNSYVRRMPQERRLPEISTSTLNYDNAVNKLVEFSKKIRTLPHSNVIADTISTKFSTSTSVQNTLSYLFMENSKYQEAEKYASKSIEIDSDNFDAYMLRSQARFSLKDIKGAIEDIKKASYIDPSDETARLLARYYERQSEFDSAKISALKDSFATPLTGESSPASVSGKSLKKESDETSQISENSITDESKKSAYYLKMAQIKTEMKDYSEALRYVNKAIEKDPSNLDSYIERANIYNLMGNYSDAISDATFVLRHDPNNIFALNIRAWALYRQGEFDKATLDTSKAIDIKPTFADAMFLRALIYEKQNRYDDMLRDLEKASRLNPAYTSYFKDAVTAYSYRAPNFMNYYERNKSIFNNLNSDSISGFSIKRFSIILIFTIVGGVLIGVSLLHMLSPRITRSTAASSSSISVSDTLSPNIFYEGVATGKYKVLKKIGQGGMGTVYLALDQSLGREVAIKKMNEDIKMNEREKQRFLEEARTVAMLHHPNIIEIYTIFEEKGDIYLVFEYIAGKSLDKKLEESVRMPFFEVRPLIIDIAKALKYAHSKNVIHRDLKLSNVMISKDGIIKVTDFGLAKVVREAKARYSSSEVVGSPAYMAPEQDLGIFLKESDLYSLGVCLYEMLSGDLPFSGPDYHYQKERKLYTPLSHIVAGLPKDTDRIVSKLLEPDPQYRYHSADEFLKDFENLA